MSLCVNIHCVHAKSIPRCLRKGPYVGHNGRRGAAKSITLTEAWGVAFRCQKVNHKTKWEEKTNLLWQAGGRRETVQTVLLLSPHRPVLCGHSHLCHWWLTNLLKVNKPADCALGCGGNFVKGTLSFYFMSMAFWNNLTVSSYSPSRAIQNRQIHLLDVRCCGERVPKFQ